MIYKNWHSKKDYPIKKHYIVTITASTRKKKNLKPVKNRNVMLKPAFIFFVQILQMSGISICCFRLWLTVECVECTFQMPVTGLEHLKCSLFTA